LVAIVDKNLSLIKSVAIPLVKFLILLLFAIMMINFFYYFDYHVVGLFFISALCNKFLPQYVPRLLSVIRKNDTRVAFTCILLFSLMLPLAMVLRVMIGK
jgi:hypothetical protein